MSKGKGSECPEKNFKEHFKTSTQPSIFPETFLKEAMLAFVSHSLAKSVCNVTVVVTTNCFAIE